MREVTLLGDVRTFRRFGEGRELARTEQWLTKGDTVFLNGQKEKLIFDHREEDAFLFEMGGETYYVLVGELGAEFFAKEEENKKIIKK